MFTRSAAVAIGNAMAPDCERTHGHLRDVHRSYADAQLRWPSGAPYQAQAALEAVEKLCGA